MAKARSNPQLAGLPPRVVVRSRVDRSGQKREYFFYETARDEMGKRRLIGLGTDRATLAHQCQIIEQDLSAAAQKAESDFRQRIFMKAKSRAALKRVGFELTRADVDMLFHRAGGHCEVSDAPFRYSKDNARRARPWIPSIDRVDSRGPYTLKNCRLVCFYVNAALNEFGYATLLSMSMRIVEYSRKHPTKLLDSIASESTSSETDGETLFQDAADGETTLGETTLPSHS